ncbi:MAG: putative peptidoglycan-binding domain-containing protein [Acidobacteriota bacterium]
MTRDEAALVIVTRVIAREGGVSDIHDGKGITRYGQTPGWLVTFGFPAPTTVQEAAQNYLTWLVRTQLISVCDYPDGFADGVVDWAVNSGHRPVIQDLQRIFGLQADGVLGPETQARIVACDRPKMARLIIGARMRFLGRLITSQPERQARWAAGWANRVASHVEALT